MKTITMPLEEYNKEIEDLKKRVREETLSRAYSEFHSFIVYGSGVFEDVCVKGESNWSKYYWQEWMDNRIKREIEKAKK